MAVKEKVIISIKKVLSLSKEANSYTCLTMHTTLPSISKNWIYKSPDQVSALYNETFIFFPNAFTHPDAWNLVGASKAFIFTDRDIQNPFFPPW